MIIIPKIEVELLSSTTQTLVVVTRACAAARASWQFLERSGHAQAYHTASTLFPPPALLLCTILMSVCRLKVYSMLLSISYPTYFTLYEL